MLIKHGENGLLVPVGNAKELYRAMCYIAENPELALRLGNRAKYIKQEADLKVIIDKWEAYIRKCTRVKL